MTSRSRRAESVERGPVFLNPLRRVLVATDFSPAARRGVWRALHLPLAGKARVHLVHVLPALDDRTRRVDVLLEEYAAREFQSLARDLTRDLKRMGRTDVAIETEIAHGIGFVEVVRSALALRADLIVIGRIGRQNWRHILLGSTAERVVWHSPIPVLVTQAKAPRPYRRIVAALDDSDAARSALRMAVRLGDTRKLRVDAVHALDLSELFAVRRVGGPEPRVRELADRARQRTQRWLDGVIRAVGAEDVAVRLEIGHGNPVDVIQEALAARKPDVVVLGTRRRDAVHRALLGSVAEAIVRRAPCDVLIARERSTNRRARR
jgi:nucleotide-binding universal stress UspA family protein